MIDYLIFIEGGFFGGEDFHPIFVLFTNLLARVKLGYTHNFNFLDHLDLP